jgi:hypothetical protein
VRLCARNAVRAVALAMAALIAASCGGPNPSPGGTPPAGALGIPGDSLHKLATNSALWPVKQSAERNCEGSWLCWIPFGRKVEVDIYADTGARNTSANPAASGPVLIGKFDNRGKSSERRYNLTNGPYDFLLFVYPVAGSREGRWVVERVAKAPTGGSYEHEQVSEGRYKGCDHPTTTYNQSFGEFRTCAMGPPPPPPGVTRTGARATGGIQHAGLGLSSFFSAVSLLLSESGDPAWFTCKAGCCVADAL